MIFIRKLLYRLFVGFNFIPRRNFHRTTKKYNTLIKFLFRNIFIRSFLIKFSNLFNDSNQIVRSIRIRLFYLNRANKIEKNKKINFNKEEYIIDYGPETRRAYILRNEEILSAEIDTKKIKKLNCGICVLENISDYYPKILECDLLISIKIESSRKEKKINFPISISSKKHGIIHSKTGENWFDYFVDLSEFIGDQIKIRFSAMFVGNSFTMFNKEKNKKEIKINDIPAIPCIAFNISGVFKMKNKKKILVISGESFTDPYWLKAISNNIVNLPNIESLSEDSLRFSNSYSTADSTLPSIMSYLTGVFPSQHSFGDYDIPIYQKNTSNYFDFLAKILSDENYTTICQTSYPRFDPMHGWGNGFDRYYQAEYPWSNDAPDAAKINRVMESLNDDNLFIFFHLTRLHAPFLSSDHLQSPQNVNVKELDLAHHGNFLPMYLSQIKIFDDQIGTIIDYLKRTKQYDNTMIILTGDHGVSMPPNWDMGKISYAHYEEHSRVPLIVKTPNWNNYDYKKIDKSPISSQKKIFEMILEFNNIPLPRYFQKLPQYFKEYEGLAITETVYHPKKNNYGISLVSNNYKYWMLAQVDWKNLKMIKILEEKLFLKDNSNGLVFEDENLIKKNPTIANDFQKKALDFFYQSSKFRNEKFFINYPHTVN